MPYVEPILWHGNQNEERSWLNGNRRVNPEGNKLLFVLAFDLNPSQDYRGTDSGG